MVKNESRLKNGPEGLFSNSKCLCGAMVLFIALLSLLAGTAREAVAQAGTSLVNGVVRDSQGAVVPDAAVTLTNTATGVVMTAATNGSGVYTFNNVVPGDYTMSAEKSGFSTETTKAMHIVVGQGTTQDFALRPGATNETITIESETVQLNTENASVGTVIEQKMVSDLPLNGRNFTQLLTLAPGVAPANTGQSGGGGQSNPVGKFSAPSINGAEVRSNYYYLDGIDNTEINYDVPAIPPIVDDIAEFKVQSHNDEAQFGGVTGGIINVVTKGGTNRYTGNVWEYLRNTVFNATNPTTVLAQQLVQNQYGFNGGGPLTIPHVYNGKNRSFVFGSYEGFRRAQPSGSAYYYVPTQAELTGDLSEICPEGFNPSGICNNPNNQLYNPFTTTETAPGSGVFHRQPFLNNNISSVLNSQAVSFAKSYFPAPQPFKTTSSGVLYNGVDSLHALTTQGIWSVRGDEQFNPRNSAFFRFTNMNQPNTLPGSTTNFVTTRDVNAEQYVGSFVHTFSPTSLFDVEFGHNELTNGQITKLSTGDSKSIITSGGIASSLACGFTGGYSSCVLPSLSIPNVAGGGEGESTTLLSNVYQWRANYTQVIGRHSFSVGFNWENDSFHVINTSDGINFGTQTVQDPSNTSYAGPYYGGLAAFLMGVAQNGGLRDTVAPLNGQRAGGFYLMDKWKLTDKLAVNLGLRYDLQIDGIYGDTKSGTIYVGDMDLSFGSLADGDPWAGSFVLQKQPGSCTTSPIAPCIPNGTLPDHVKVSSDGHVFKPNYNNWQPRFGLAYQLNNKTALRGGFGIFDDLWGGITQSIQNIGGTWPTTGQITSAPINGAKDMAVVNWQNPIASASQGSANLPAPTPFDNQQWYRQPTAKNPYSEQWNFGIERELGNSTVVSANYVGSQTHHLIVGGLYNTALTPGPGDPVAREPYPYIEPTFYDRSVGNSSYNALQVSANHQAARGLSYLVSYTWSKAIDLGCDGFFGGEGCSTPNPYDLRPDRSVAGTDLPQVLSASFIAPSPVGKGQRFTTHSAIGDYLIGNWSLNGIAQFTSGLPFNISESGDAANVNHNVSWDNYNRPDLVGDPHISNPSRTKWFNTGAFQATAPYTFGKLGRNSMRADSFTNVDLSIFRTFPIGESRNVQFRADAFNVFNHPTWGIPDSNLQDTPFGTVSSTRSTERQLQFALRMHF